MEEKGSVQKLNITVRWEKKDDGTEGVRTRRKSGHCVLRMSYWIGDFRGGTQTHIPWFNRRNVTVQYMVDCQINDSIDNVITVWRIWWRGPSFGHIHVYDHGSMKRFL